MGSSGVPLPQSMDQGEDASAQRPSRPMLLSERGSLAAGGVASAIAGGPVKESIPGNGPKGHEHPASHQLTRARSPPPRASAGGHASAFSTPYAVPQVVLSRRSLFDAGYLQYDTGKPPNECAVDIVVRLDPNVLPHVRGMCIPEHPHKQVQLVGVKLAKDTTDIRALGEKTSYGISYGALLDKAQKAHDVAYDSPLGVALTCAMKHNLSWDGRLCKITITKVDMGRWRPGTQVPQSTGTTHSARSAQPSQTFSQSHAAQDHAQDDAAADALLHLLGGKKADSQGDDANAGGDERSPRTRGGSRSSGRGTGTTSDTQMYLSGNRQPHAREEGREDTGDHWYRFAADLDPNDGNQIKITKDVLHQACFSEPYGEEITVHMKVFVCGRPRSLWDKTEEFKQIKVKLPKKGTTDYYSIKMAQLIKNHLAEEWDSFMMQHKQGRENIVKLMKAIMTWKVEAFPDLPKGGIAWDPALRCFPVRLVPQTNPHWQQLKQGSVPGSGKKKPGRKKRPKSFGTDDEQEPKKRKYNADRRASAPGGFVNGSQEGEVKVKNKGGRLRKDVPAAEDAAGGGAGTSAAATVGASARGRPRKPTDKAREAHMQEGSGSESDSGSSSSSSQDDDGMQGDVAAGQGGGGPGNAAGEEAADFGPGTQRQQQQRPQLRLSEEVGPNLLGQKSDFKKPHKPSQPVLRNEDKAIADAVMKASAPLVATPRTGHRVAEPSESAAAAAATAAAAKGAPVHPVQAPRGSVKGASGLGGGGEGASEHLRQIAQERPSRPSQAPSNHQEHPPSSGSKLDLLEECDQRFERARAIQRERLAQKREAAGQVEEEQGELEELEKALSQFVQCGLLPEYRDLLSKELRQSLAKRNEELQKRRQVATEVRESWEKAKDDEEHAYKEFTKVRAMIDS